MILTDLFQEHGGSLIMLAKGNRSQQVIDACRKHGGFYLGSIGGPAAVLAKDSIKSWSKWPISELGMKPSARSTSKLPGLHPRGLQRQRFFAHQTLNAPPRPL